MQMEIIVTDGEPESMEELTEFFRGRAECASVETDKRDPTTQSLYDAITVAIQAGGALGALAAGAAILVARLGDRAKVMIKKDGTVIAENVSSSDAAKIVETQVKGAAAPR